MEIIKLIDWLIDWLILFFDFSDPSRYLCLFLYLFLNVYNSNELLLINEVSFLSYWDMRVIGDYQYLLPPMTEEPSSGPLGLNTSTTQYSIWVSLESTLDFESNIINILMDVVWTSHWYSYQDRPRIETKSLL